MPCARRPNPPRTQTCFREIGTQEKKRTEREIQVNASAASLCCLSVVVMVVSAVVSACSERRGDPSVKRDSGGQVLAGSVHGPEQAPVRPLSLANTRVLKLRSARVGIDYLLYIGLPRGYDGKRTYPVTVVLDADYCFSIVHGITYLLADHDEMAPMILVGIAYPGVAGEKRGPLFKLNRTRDYTPTHVSTGGYGRRFQKLSGGADRFLDFVSKELFPFLERRFRVKPGHRAVIGYSYGGLLATYALLTRPSLFQRFVIVSPSLWWDRHVISKMEEKRASLAKDLPSRAFFSVGGRETRAFGSTDMALDLAGFVSKLRSRNHPLLEIDLWVAPDETHHSVFPAAAMRGMRRVLREISAEP